MVITNKGDNYFSIQSGETSILVDPNNQRSFKGTLLVLNTLKPALVEPTSDGTPFFIDNQGEYEVSGIRIRGFSAGFRTFNGVAYEHTAYHVLFDDISLGILGHFAALQHSEALEHVAGVDVLILPAGNGDLMTPSEAARIVRQLEPAIVIPAFTKNLAAFAKEMDTDLNYEEKLTFKRKDLKEKGMEVHFLKF